MYNLHCTTEIQHFTKESLEKELNTCLQDSRLLGVAAVFGKYQREMEEEDRRIEKAALEFLPETWTFKDGTLRKVRGEVACNEFFSCNSLFEQ